MDFSVIRPALRDLIASLSGLPDGLTVWEEEQRPILDPATLAVVLLQIRPVSSVGSSDVKEEEFSALRPQGTEFQEKILGARKLVLSIKVETYDTPDGQAALTYAERIRNRLAFSSSLAKLREVDVSLAKRQALQDLHRTENDRRVAVAVLDVHLNAHVQEVDSANRYGYIETVELVADIHGTQENP